MKILSCIPAIVLLAVACAGGDSRDGQGRREAEETFQIADFQEACPEGCGATLAITESTRDGEILSFLVSIENTGQRGTQRLVLDNSRVLIFNETQARSWHDHVSRSSSDMLNFLNSESYTIVELSFSDGTRLPEVLVPGQKWESRAGPAATLPPDAVAFVVNLGLIHTQRLVDNELRYNWLSFNEETPLIMLEPLTFDR